MKNRPVFTSLSPNTEKDDIRLALKLLFRPDLWQESGIEKEFSLLFNSQAYAFNSGRSAWLAILKSLCLNPGDEVLVQAFTCNAAINPILACNLNPIYVDCDDTFNMDVNDLKNKLSYKSKVVLVQHTFGQPADMDNIAKVCQEHKLILIEDCAHSLGAEYQEKPVGTFGKASFFSFSRDKVISSVYGGMAITNDLNLGNRIKLFQEECDHPSVFWTIQQLLHPVLVNYIIIPCYYFPWLGKIILNFFQIVGLLSKSVHKKEKRGEFPNYFPKKLPKALGLLALNQLKKLDRFNEHRQKIADLYAKEFGFFQKSTKGRIFLKFPLLSKDILNEARKKRLLLDDGWRKSPIVPLDTNLDMMRYIKGSCPEAEKISNMIVNLPTHININEQEVKRIIDLL